MRAYYNEHDEFAAQWLRNLIAAGHLAPGDVDTRSIRDVQPDDLRGYTQAHFFAGIGIWSHALRAAGWADDREVWTGSCPCQPFSAAGKRKGTDDDRHLWPEFYRLIAERGPDTVLGEQVASKDGLAWLEGVQADLERAGYAVGAVDTCAAGFADEAGNEGFHIRQRLYWGAKRLGHADDARPQGRSIGRLGADQRAAGPSGMAGETFSFGVGDALLPERRPFSFDRQDGPDGAYPGRQKAHGVLGAPSKVRHDGRAGEADGLAHTDGEAGSGRGVQGQGQGASAGAGAALERPAGLRADSGAHGGLAHTDGRNPGAERQQRGGQHGLVTQNRGVDWLYCRDGKYRPVEGGTFPLAHADTQRVGRLRAYGNALDAAQARGFVEAWLDCCP